MAVGDGVGDGVIPFSARVKTAAVNLQSVGDVPVPGIHRGCPGEVKIRAERKMSVKRADDHRRIVHGEEDFPPPDVPRCVLRLEIEFETSR